MRLAGTISVALLALAACGGNPRMNDPRAQTLLRMSGPMHYAERIVARELAGRCLSYSYDEELAQSLSQARVKAGLETSVQVRGAADLGFAVDRAACDAAQTAANAARLAGEVASGAPDALYAFCVEANAASTEYSMVTIALIYVVAAGFFVLCARKLKQDLVA